MFTQVKRDYYVKKIKCWTGQLELLVLKINFLVDFLCRICLANPRVKYAILTTISEEPLHLGRQHPSVAKKMNEHTFLNM